jgi:hypothetical protein
VTCSYYIYYRTRRAAHEVRAVVRAMQAALVRSTGVTGRLLHRADDPTTWMEVYEAVPDASDFEQHLAAEVARCGIERLLDEGAVRHVERFVPAA